VFARHAKITREIEQWLRRSVDDSVTAIPVSPSTTNYCNWLSTSITQESVPSALGAILPCYCVYDELRDYILSRMNQRDQHPHRRWLAIFVHDDIVAQTAEAERACETVLETFNIDDQAAFARVFGKGVTFERRLFECLGEDS